MDRLEYVLKAKQHGRMEEQVFCAFLGNSPREDFIPTSPTSICSSRM
jgi:hypothetical protein